MGGEGNNESKRRHLERHMAEFSHIQHRIKEQQQKQSPQQKSKINWKALYIDAKKDIESMFKVMIAMGALKHPQLKNGMMELKRKYKL